jgi:hypothetical protein
MTWFIHFASPHPAASCPKPTNQTCVPSGHDFVQANVVELQRGRHAALVVVAAAQRGLVSNPLADCQRPTAASKLVAPSVLTSVMEWCAAAGASEALITSLNHQRLRDEVVTPAFVGSVSTPKDLRWSTNGRLRRKNLARQKETRRSTGS